MNKETAIETVKRLPHEFNLEELMERLVLVEKIEQGLKQLDEGKTVSHEQLKDRVKEWQK